MLHPRGLVPKLLGLRFQFHGDWSQWIASFISEFPTHLRARRCKVICNTIFSVSLRTWIASLAIHECLRRNQTVVILPGCVFIIICIWLSVNSLSSPVNGYSEGRRPMPNVGVHSYISTQSSSTSKELLYSVVLWLCRNCILSHMQRRSYRWVSLATFIFYGSVWPYTPVRCPDPRHNPRRRMIQ